MVEPATRTDPGPPNPGTLTPIPLVGPDTDTAHTAVLYGGLYARYGLYEWYG